MTNPWNNIDLQHYEDHMSAHSVMQLQLLNRITKEQLERYTPAKVAILGVAGGNGLEHINPSITSKVYAFDINGKYLDECARRYGYLGDRLESHCINLKDSDVFLPITDLIICNLIVEYMGEESFAALILRNLKKIKAISVVIQINQQNAFVSESSYSHNLKSLSDIHHDIDTVKLNDLLFESGYKSDFQKDYDLPNGKKLRRIDFILRPNIDSFVT